MSKLLGRTTDYITTKRAVINGTELANNVIGHKLPIKAFQFVQDSPQKVEVRIAPKDGKALCVSGGLSTAQLDLEVDYAMTADTKRWIEMGKGEYGPMRAMMFGRLSFDGPMGEAMGNMGPFESFLLLVGKVPGDTAACPK